MHKELKEARDLDIMNNPGTWSRFPYLPIIRRQVGAPQEAVLVAGGGPVVYYANVFCLELPVNMNGIRKQEYESFEAIVGDGWLVD